MSDAGVADGEFSVHLPRLDSAALDQDSEWCELETAEGTRRIRFHDYAGIYEVPGLYEHLFYDELECQSPMVVRSLLADVLDERDVAPEDLVVLDVGAGNGMAGAELAELGAGSIVGVDILEEAAAATERDRPGIYDDYRVVDLTDPSPEDHAALSDAGFNCLTSVAALGFGDMPPDAFGQAFDYVDDGGLVALTLKERFTQPREDESGYSRLLRRLRDEGRLEPIAEERYRHRLSMTGAPIHYVAMVAEKRPGTLA